MYALCANTSGLQYIHGLAARGVHYIHRPGATLQDVGFILLPVCINSPCSLSLQSCNRKLKFVVHFIFDTGE